MDRRRWLLFTFLLISALVLVACPSGGGSSAPAAPADGAAPAEEAAPAATPTEDTAQAAEPAAEEAAEGAGAAAEAQGPALIIWADDTRAPALTALAADFEAQYGLRLVVTEKAFDNIRDDFKVAAPTGEGPDIIIGAHDWLGELAENGLLAEVSLGDKEDQFLPVAVQAFVYDGTLYGMPYATENVAFIYNPELVAEPPTTWSEVTEISAQIAEEGSGAQGFIIQENDPYHFFPIMTAFGGYVFGLTEEGYDPSDIGIDNEGSIAAAQWLNDMYAQGYLMPGAAINYDLMHAAFENGEAAMMISGPWALPRIRASGIPYAVTDLPNETQNSQPFLGVQGFMVSAFSDDQLLAQTFLQEFVATEEAMQAIFDTDPRPSAFVPVRENIEDEDIAAFAAAGEDGMAMPAIPEMSAVWDSWGNALQLIGQQAVDPEAAFVEAAEQIRSAIGGQ